MAPWEWSRLQNQSGVYGSKIVKGPDTATLAYSLTAGSILTAWARKIKAGKDCECTSAEGTLDCGGSTPPWNDVGDEHQGGVEPPQSKVRAEGLGEDYRLHPGNIKPLPAPRILALHDVIAAKHVRLRLGKLGAITFVRIAA
jgi:hypothetical protein